jgi:alpha-1,2-mannosyltransferase
VAAVAAFAVVAVALAWRAGGDLSPDRQNVGAFADFRDAVYYPVKALVDGVNPYDTPAYMARYPVAQVFPVYGPHHLLLWLPLAVLPIGAARVVFGLVMLAVLVLVCRLSVSATGTRASVPIVFGVSALALVSTPGRFNFLTGQSTMLAVLGCCLAFWYATDRPALAGAGIALAALKPVYALPVVVLLLAQRHLRAVLWGAGITAALCLPATVALVVAAGGPSDLASSIGDNLSETSDAPSIDPVSSETRVDLHSLIAKAADGLESPAVAAVVLVAVLAGAAVVLRRDGVRDRPVVQLAVALAVLLSVVHQQYDMLLLVAPIVGLVVARSSGAPTTWRRSVLLALCLVAAFNPLATDAVTRSLDEDRRPLGIATTAALLAGALVLALAEVARERRSPAVPPAEAVPVGVT